MKDLKAMQQQLRVVKWHILKTKWQAGVSVSI
jgi:hypothetical protein